MKTSAFFEPSRRDWAHIDTRRPRRQRQPFDGLGALTLICLVVAMIGLSLRVTQLLAADDVGAPAPACAIAPAPSP
jgi:type VI protein secretion system component VasF